MYRAENAATDRDDLVSIASIFVLSKGDRRLF